MAVSRGDGSVLIVTAGHVLGALSTAPPPIHGHVVHFGDGPEPLVAYKGTLGRIERRVPDGLPEDRRLVHDVATIEVGVHGRFENHVAGFAVNGVRAFAFDDPELAVIDVWIEGAASGARPGRLHTRRVARTVSVAHSEPATHVLYRNACWVEPVDGRDAARDGDSGAVCIDAEGRAVAMVVAAENPAGDGAPPARALTIPFWLLARELAIRDDDVTESVVLTPGFS